MTTFYLVFGEYDDHMYYHDAFTTEALAEAAAMGWMKSRIEDLDGDLDGYDEDDFDDVCSALEDLGEYCHVEKMEVRNTLEEVYA